MNNIYKVIWSKAKNCYVVASEIARSHTKSASGSGKIGGVTRRSLLASLMALSLLCGGLGVASAADSTVHVDASTTPGNATEVYTTTGVNALLADYGKKTDVETNKNDITALQTTTTEHGEKITANATNIARNAADIGKKIDMVTAEAKLALKANAEDVYSKTDADTRYATKNALDGKADITYVDQKFTDAGTNVDNKLEDYYNKAEVDGKIKAEENARDTAITNAITQERNDRTTAIDTAINGEATARNQAINTAITQEVTARNLAVANAKAELQGKITAEETARKEADTDFNTRLTTAEGKIGANETAIGDLKAADTALEGEITKNREDIATLNGKVATAEGNITDLKAKDTDLEKKIQTNADNIQTNNKAIADTNKRTAGIDRIDARHETTIEGHVTVDDHGNVTADGAVNAGSLTVTGASELKGDVTLGTLNGTNTVTVNGTANFNAAVNMDKGLNVTNGATKLKETTVEGKLTAGDAELKNTEVKGTLGVTGATTLGDTLTAKGEATFKEKVTAERDLEVKGELKTDKIAMENKKTDADGRHNSSTTITADYITHIGEVEKSGVTTKSSFTHNEKGSETYATKGDKTDWTETHSDVTADGVKTEVKDSKKNRTNTSQTADGIKGYATDEKGNKTYTKVTATENSFQVQDKDGKNKNHQVNTKDSSVTEITNGDGKTTKTEQTATDIINTAKDGTIKNEANHIENTATTMKTTVTGQATEEFNGGLDTTVAGTEKHTVNGKQINTVTEGQENIISGGQTNTITGGQTNNITGGQTNNITGDQTTTITGNKKETVTENVTEDYQKDLTTTVGGNENHEVKGTKTETVEGKVTENYKAGQATNVTGDQDIKVSGTQTTTATAIKRNASSGMIDTIDNDYGTNTETKVAGKTTTDVSIKGTGEEGKYIRGANESRDYLIKGTLKNSETKTVEKTSTEITDGNGKTSATIQDKTQISGSVTNGTSSAVSNVKADSIDTAVIEGTNTSLISQKKDSITSAVGNDTTSTVIQQGEKDITIASNGGTVGIAGKDIINNATNEITNTAGTKITDKVGNNTRVIDQTSITDTVGTASRKIEDGKITDTAGDSTVTTENGKGTTFAKAGSAAYSTEAGAPTDTNIAGNHITTGRVDANELGVSDKDDQGNTAGLSVKAGEGNKGGIKGYATDKDGNKTYMKVTATENSFQVQDKDGKNKNHQVNTKDSSENTITNGDKTNTVTSTADGTTFNNSKAATPVTGASGAGTAVNTTIKGNTITTGKVTMDYADVMKDLGVRGNANITGKTTTGSLEVTGTSTLTGDVTMGSNATVNGNFNVEGNTNLKNTQVDGTLKVTKMATFDDSVSIAKDLSVDGNATIKGDVTAKSYNVDGKTYIDANGIHANNQKITDVADGSISEGSKDAVNGGQLYNVKNDLEGKVNKVGANAAAMANLHPMEFDPDSKWNIAAAMGNYGSETATAIGAFYRPNEDVMVNLSTAFGTGENMVGGGVSVRLGKGSNKLSREESNALKAQVNDLTARMDALLSVLNPNMSKDFPDVPENHWAYEAVSRLAGNDIVQGYPDGEFHGDRTMTRYEMAEIIYNALSRGAEAERELVEEFKPELQAMAASEKATAERAEG